MATKTAQKRLGDLGDALILKLNKLKSDTDNSIDAIEVGGRNYIVQSGEERSSSYERNISSYIISNNINLLGRRVTISYDVKSSNGTDSYYASISRSHPSSIARFQETESPTTEYVRKIITFVYPPTDEAVTVIFINRLSNHPNNSGTVYIKNVKLELGNKATDWTPAPEDQVTDWNETNEDSFSYLKNKPSKLTQFLNDLGNYGDWITKVQSDGWYEPKFTKNPAFNKNFGTGAGTVAQGNDSRLVEAFKKKVNAMSFTGDTNKTLTITREDGTTLSASFLDNNDPQYPDDVLNILTFNLNNDGVLRAVTSEGEIISVSLDGRYSLLTDSRFTNAREWTAATVSQSEAETGTATTRRAWTAQRVRQAIVAWWNTVKDDFALKTWVSENFDKYVSWQLKVNGVNRSKIKSFNALDFIAGNNIRLEYDYDNDESDKIAIHCDVEESLDQDLQGVTDIDNVTTKPLISGRDTSDNGVYGFIAEKRVGVNNGSKGYTQIEYNKLINRRPGWGDANAFNFPSKEGLYESTMVRSLGGVLADPETGDIPHDNPITPLILDHGNLCYEVSNLGNLTRVLYIGGSSGTFCFFATPEDEGKELIYTNLQNHDVTISVSSTPVSIGPNVSNRIEKLSKRSWYRLRVYNGVLLVVEYGSSPTAGGGLPAQ